MWSGDWGQFPQESLRLLNSKVETKSFLEDVKSLIFTLGSAEDGDNHMVRVACLGPYLLATTYFSKDCEIWARSSGIFFHPSKLSDNALTPEIREVILVLDTLAYHVCLLLVASTGGNKCHIGCGLENKHQNFLKEFDKEVVYSKVVALVEPSEFFKAFRKKLQTTLKDEQILGCFMIALKASMAHCSGVLDTMLTFIVKDCTDNDKATEGNQLKVSGNKKFKEGAYLEAHALYTEAISKVRFNHLLYSNRALCSLQLSRYKEVELDARRAIILSPNFEKGYYKTAQVYESQKQCHQAKQVMEYYIERCHLRVVNVSAEVKDFYEKLGKAAEQKKNGKTEPKSSQAVPIKSKKKPVALELLSDSDSEDTKPAKPTPVYKSNIPRATLIKKASEDLLAGLFKSALQGYKEALVSKSAMPESELVVLKYAAGHAAASLDSLEVSFHIFVGMFAQ
ncbi:E3 ubiquitin-protein ligase TTC3 isoform X2 [Ixodes scapularis]